MWRCLGFSLLCVGLLRSPSLATDALSLGALQDDVQSVLEAWRGGVVRVVSHHVTSELSIHSRVASGVVWDRRHVVTYDADLAAAKRVDIWLPDGTRTAGSFVGADPLTGLAVLSVDAPIAFPRVHRRSRAMKNGEMALVMGNAFGTEASISLGFVSGGVRSVSDGSGRLRHLLQLTAPASPGDAGGAVLDAEGQLVGFVIGSPQGAGGVTLAVPYRQGRRGVERLVARGGDHGFLGITVEEPIDGIRGLPVVDVMAGGPADVAGLRPGDRIISVDGARPASVEMLLETVVYSPVGSRLAITAHRGDARMETEAVVAARRPSPTVMARSVVASEPKSLDVDERIDALEQELSGIREALARCDGGGTPSEE